MFVILYNIDIYAFIKVKASGYDLPSNPRAHAYGYNSDLCNEIVFIYYLGSKSSNENNC